MDADGWKRTLEKAKKQGKVNCLDTLASFSLISIIVNLISLGFYLLFRQSKPFEEMSLGSGDLQYKNISLFFVPENC